MAVYRDQLAEIESERADGLIAAPEAEAARAEVARRLIRSAEQSSLPSMSGSAAQSRARSVTLLVAASIPVLALAVYLAIGQPALPGRPYAARLNAPLEQASAADLVAKVEAHLRQHPDDGRGWDVLAPVYLRMGDFQQASDAFARATRLLGESPKRLAGFARATILLENGVVGEPARQAYVKLLKLDPKAIEAQVWLAIAKEQDGDVAGAAAEYQILIDGAGSQEPWRGLLDQRLNSAIAKLNGTAPPSPPEAEAIKAMTPEARQQFVEQMVTGLAERLKKDGKDLEGWMRLVRAYSVLGKKSEASTALDDARRSFAGDEKSLAELDELAQRLGLGS
jgi:cytochrome c-type biogenesis protein CcmH